jgi:hypothetical protein
MKPSVKLERESNNLKERAPSLRFRVLDDEWRAWGHKEVKGVAKGGAPLMRGAHKTCESSNTWQIERGGVSLVRRGAT